MASQLYTKWNIIYRIINISVSSFNASCSLEHISHPASCSLVSFSSPYSSSYSFSSSSFSLFSSFCSSSSSFFVYTTHQIQVVFSIMGNWNICTWWTQEMWTVCSGMEGLLTSFEPTYWLFSWLICSQGLFSFCYIEAKLYLNVHSFYLYLSRDWTTIFSLCQVLNNQGLLCWLCRRKTVHRSIW